MRCMLGMSHWRIFTIIYATWYSPTANRVCIYEHPFYFQETRVLHTTDMRLTHEMHSIRAHLVHYTSLLEDYKMHVRFIMDTRNPMQDSHSPQDRTFSQEILGRECGNLLAEINRLKDQLCMQERRLENTMGLVFCFQRFINIGR